jgi:hypothetical protein
MYKSMKLFFFALAAAGTLLACQSGDKDVREEAAESLQTVQPADNAAAQNAANQKTAPAGPTTEITFDETEFNFGTVTDGEVVEHTYTFTNTGDEPLIISDARGSCGCTVPDWPKEPIAQGEEGKITVRFDSKRKVGDRRQKVTITANTEPAQTFIYLVGKVEAGENSGKENQPGMKVVQ